MGYIFCKKDVFGGKITWLCKPLRTERNGTFVPTLNVCFKIAHFVLSMHSLLRMNSDSTSLKGILLSAAVGFFYLYFIGRCQRFFGRIVVV